MPPILTPLPYHVNLRVYLQKHESELWAWFSSAEAASDYAAHVRLDLLKSTYRLEREEHTDLYGLLDAAIAAVGVDVRITLYQWQQESGINAAMFYTPTECHVAFVGNILTLLSEVELAAVFGHELAHIKLWKEDESSYFIVDSILNSMANDPRAVPSYHETARLFRLYTELYCDRGALVATGDLAAVQASLIKTHTGLATVSADSYRRQVEEIMLHPGAPSDQRIHPELHIRTRALDIFARAESGNDASESQSEMDPEKQIEDMIEGDADLDRLDLLAQARLTELSKRFVAAVVAKPWMRTEIVMGHAKLFDADISIDPSIDGSTFAGQLKLARPSIRDYFSYILLDFATVDSDIEDAAMAWSIQFADAAGLTEPFIRIVTKDLKLTKRDVTRLLRHASATIDKADGQHKSEVSK